MSSLALASVLVLFVGVPLGLLLAQTATGKESWSSVWLDAANLQALGGTLATSFGAALFAFAAGFPLAIIIGRTDIWSGSAIQRLLTIPAALPPFILGMGWVALANPRAGLLNQLLGPGTLDIYGRGGISFVLGSAGMPLVFLPSLAVLKRIDSSLDEAARLCGASPWRTLMAVAVPLTLPAALSGAALCFLFAASAFGVPYLLGVTATPPSPTLTTRIYAEVLMPDGLPRAIMLSVELLLIAVIVLVFSRAMARRGSVRLPSGKGGTVRPMSLGQWKAPVSIVCGLTTLVLVILPLAAVALASIQPVWGQWTGLSTRHWVAVLGNVRTLNAAATSLSLATGAAALVTLLGLGVATTRHKALEFAATAPYAIPGTVLALALVLAFSREMHLIIFDRWALVLALGNSLSMLLVAYTVKHLAFGVRNAADGLAQVDLSLAEAARLAGAGPARAFVDALLPQLKSPLAAAFLITFLTCVTELTLSVLLMPPGREVLGTLLFELQSYADPGSAAVIACAFVGLVLVVQMGQSRLARQVR